MPNRAPTRAPVSVSESESESESASLTITTQRTDRVFIQARGRLDRVGIARLRTALVQARRMGSVELVVDLRAVTWWDHSLARVLAWAKLQLRGRDQHLSLTGATAGLRAEIDTEENRLSYPLWRGLCPDDPRYRPVTTDQP
jgi:hypothetical protein